MEIEAAEAEGVEILFLAAPTKILGEGGSVRRMEFIRMRLTDPDPSGRRRPEPMEGSEKLMEVDTVIVAIGQSPGIDFVREDKLTGQLRVTRWNTIDAQEETLQTSLPFVFTGGDCFTGPSIAVEAIGAGRYAARCIHYFIVEGKIPPIPSRQRTLIKDSLLEHLEGVQPVPRVHPHELPVNRRIRNFEEVEHTISPDEAQREANRCLRCGLICYNRDVVEALIEEQTPSEAAAVS
jgi:NADPH-dependent glutamate synthase beta subunit-like oxidoreductase